MSNTSAQEDRKMEEEEAEASDEAEEQEEEEDEDTETASIDVIGTATSDMWTGISSSDEDDTFDTASKKAKETKLESSMFSASIQIDEETLAKHLALIAKEGGGKSLLIPGRLKVRSAAEVKDRSSAESEKIKSSKKKLLIEVSPPSKGSTENKPRIVLKARGHAECQKVVSSKQDQQEEYAKGIEDDLSNATEEKMFAAPSEATEATQRDREILEPLHEGMAKSIQEQLAPEISSPAKGEREETGLEEQPDDINVMKVSAEASHDLDTHKEEATYQSAKAEPQSANTHTDLVRQVNSAYNLIIPEGSHTFDEHGAYIGVMKSAKSTSVSQRIAGVPSTCLKKIEETMPQAKKQEKAAVAEERGLKLGARLAKEEYAADGKPEKFTKAKFAEDFAGQKESQQSVYVPMPKTKSKKTGLPSTPPRSPPKITGEKTEVAQKMTFGKSEYVAPKKWRKHIKEASEDRSPTRKTDDTYIQRTDAQQSEYVLPTKYRIRKSKGSEDDRKHLSPRPKMAEDFQDRRRDFTAEEESKPEYAMQSEYLLPAKYKHGKSPGSEDRRKHLITRPEKAVDLLDHRKDFAAREEARFGYETQQSEYALPQKHRRIKRQGSEDREKKFGDSTKKADTVYYTREDKTKDVMQQSEYVMPAKHRSRKFQGSEERREKSEKTEDFMRRSRGSLNDKTGFIEVMQQSEYVSPVKRKSKRSEPSNGQKKSIDGQDVALQSVYMAPPKWKERAGTMGGEAGPSRSKHVNNQDAIVAEKGTISGITQSTYLARKKWPDKRLRSSNKNVTTDSTKGSAFIAQGQESYYITAKKRSNEKSATSSLSKRRSEESAENDKEDYD